MNAQSAGMLYIYLSIFFCKLQIEKQIKVQSNKRYQQIHGADEEKMIVHKGIKYFSRKQVTHEMRSSTAKAFTVELKKQTS